MKKDAFFSLGQKQNIKMVFLNIRFIFDTI